MTYDEAVEKGLGDIVAKPGELLYNFYGDKKYNWETKQWDPMTEEEIQEFKEQQHKNFMELALNFINSTIIDASAVYLLKTMSRDESINVLIECGLSKEESERIIIRGEEMIKEGVLDD